MTCPRVIVVKIVKCVRAFRARVFNPFLVQCSLDMSGKETYLCNFVRLKGKSIFPLRGTQTNNSNSVACVRDSRRVLKIRCSPMERLIFNLFEPDSPPGRPNKNKQLKTKNHGTKNFESTN